MINFKEPYIQVAGIRSREEAEMLIGCGIKYLGFPLRLDYHKEDVTDEEASAIISSFPEGVHGVLITYLDRGADIVALCDDIGADIVQVHGDIELEEILSIKRLNPGIGIIKSLVVKQYNLPVLEETMRQLSPYVDAFITDTFDNETGAKGATGKMHDLTVSRHISEVSPKPVILAGGLNPNNVYDAIRLVRPAGVDVHTGVEDSSGNKDINLVNEFVGNTVRAYKSGKE